ncbi:MAG TPA: tail fiber domain-containing protein [Ferruginibacter sp.]|nr:tail fiber domain-containing protein [Ferruginibacter sp.]
MKKILLLLFSQCLLNGLIEAQNIGLGTTTPDASAMLDIKSNTKGLLIPRTSTVSRLAIINPAKGLILYDSTTNNFWFYNGSSWNSMTDNNASWKLNGNAAVNSSTQFIGTTDNQPIRLRVNNTWAGEINPSNGNIGLGLNAGPLQTTGINNTALGIASLANNVTGSNNVAIGDSALYNHNNPGTNVAVGTHALYKNTIGIANTAVGPYALYRNDYGGYNTAIGVNSLSNNINGDENVAIGSRALQFNGGSFNTSTGASSLRFSLGGTSNVANGYQALYSNTYGSYNTAMGFDALYSNSTGQENTAIGAYALHENTTGLQNTAIGSYAMFYQSFNNNGISWNSGNTAVGYQALYRNQPTSINSGINNTAIGSLSLRNNTNGTDNTGIGYNVLNANTTGSQNTALGIDALKLNEYGSSNVSIGRGSLAGNLSGNNNTALGGYSLFRNSAGHGNVAIGQYALQNNNNGNENIAIGYWAGTHPNTPSIYNTISIGNSDILNAFQNQAFIGNTSTQWIGGQTTWSTYSDARIKNNIHEDVKGLEFITRLRPVTYYISNRAIISLTGNKETPDFPGKNDNEKTKRSGFIAQEVEQAAKSAGYDFSGYTVPQNAQSLYSLSYEQFVVPLVKAVQEQQIIINTQQKQILDLEKRLSALESKP